MPIVRANSKTLAIMPVTDQMGRQFSLSELPASGKDASTQTE